MWKKGSRDCWIETIVQDQPKETSSTQIGVRIGTSDVNKLYQENFNVYLYYR